MSPSTTIIWPPTHNFRDHFLKIGTDYDKDKVAHSKIELGVRIVGEKNFMSH